jgi:hypothetical protein
MPVESFCTMSIAKQQSSARYRQGLEKRVHLETLRHVAAAVVAEDDELLCRWVCVEVNGGLVMNVSERSNINQTNKNAAVDTNDPLLPLRHGQNEVSARGTI